MCDEGHLWEVFEPTDGEPSEEFLTCEQDGLPAVTAMRLPLADRAVVQISPLAWEREGVEGRIDEYLLEIRSSVSSDARMTSTVGLSWDEAIRYAGMFKGIPWEQAQQRWKRVRRLSERGLN